MHLWNMQMFMLRCILPAWIQKLAKERELEIESEKNELLQPKISIFVGFIKVLENITKVRYEEVDNIDEAMALTTTDLSNSTSL